MAPRAARHTRSAAEGAPGETVPTYLRARFVLAVVALAALLGLLMFRLGDVAPVRHQDRTADERPAMDVQAETSPRSTDPDDCPEPGAAVSFDAVEILAVFMAAVADPDVGEIPAVPEVQDQIDATAPSPPLSRMTRVRGFAGEPGTWSTCVMSYWMGAKGPMQSLDVVTVAVVRGADGGDGDDGTSGADRGGDRSGVRSGDQGDADDEYSTGSASRGSGGRSGSAGQRWEITRWLRGVPQPVPLTRVAPLSFFDGSGCSGPDRVVSVPIASGPPEDRLRAAIEELVSGPAGRSPTVSSSVPLDLQVLDASVEGTVARIELTPTSEEDMSRCEGTAAYEQVVGTAEAIAAETLGPEGAGRSGVQVDVVVEGRSVDTLRP